MYHFICWQPSVYKLPLAQFFRQLNDWIFAFQLVRLRTLYYMPNRQRDAEIGLMFYLRSLFTQHALVVQVVQAVLWIVAGLQCPVGLRAVEDVKFLS